MTPAPAPPVESALPTGQDPRAHARHLQRVRDTALSGRGTAPGARPVIGASWRRVRGSGVDPSGGPAAAPLDLPEVERRRAASGLSPVLPVLRARLLPAAEAAGQLMVVVDADGRVLWREGGSPVRRQADRLGFVEGSAWDERSVGTNAIGTSLVTGAPLQVFAAEHWSESHQPWTCAAAPLHDPVSGRLLGAVDLSGPAHTVHATTVALVDAVARLAELEVWASRARSLEGLRALAAPLLARLPGRGLVVALDGTVAAATGLPAPGRVPLPDGLGAGALWLPAWGACTAEALPGGWLLRLDAVAAPEAASVLLLDLTQPAPRVRVAGRSGSVTHVLSLRHAEILLALVLAPEGRTASQLADDLFAEPSRTVTVRAELSRLRRTLGPLLEHQPYRVGGGTRVELRLPPSGPVLAASGAPVVQRLRSERALAAT